MNTCQRCGRDKVIPRGKLCCTCYRHRKIEQNPELAPKLEGRYGNDMKRVKPNMEYKVVYKTNIADRIDRLGKVPSEWRGTLRMGLRIKRDSHNKARFEKTHTGLDPLPMPRVK